MDCLNYWNIYNTEICFYRYHLTPSWMKFISPNDRGRVSAPELNSHAFIMEANPRVCSERRGMEERDIVNDVEDDK